MIIIVPLESPSLLDPSSRGLERPKVVGCDFDMVPVWFNADVVGALVTARVGSVGFVPRKKNLPCIVMF
jgi:hypothetical protein